VGSTFHQLDTSVSESFPVKVGDDALSDAFAKVDKAYLAAIEALNQPDILTQRDAKIREAVSAENTEGADVEMYTGTWAYSLWIENDHLANAAVGACIEVAETVPEFTVYKNAVIELSKAYKAVYGAPYYPGYSESSPPWVYLLGLFTKIAEDSNLAKLTDLLNTHPSTWAGNGAPYGVYSDDPYNADIYSALAVGISSKETPFYSAASAVLSDEIDADGELGLKIYKGREPLFAAIGIYGNLLGLYPWTYEVVPLDTFKENWTRIKGSYHIYYNNDDPARVIFADRTIQMGTLKYIATCEAAATDAIRRGSEEFTTYIFPSETCAVVPVPPPGEYLGVEFPSFSSTQRIDATSPNGDRAFMYDLTTNAIPRYPKYVDSEKWSVMDLIHELWLLAESLAPICGDGGKRKAELNDLLNEFGLNVRENPSGGPLFIGQLPTDGQGRHVTLEFTLMADFAARLRKMIDEVYKVRDAVLAATQAW
jgi:hypothetical protein